jgi:hypothetical protein
MSIAAVFLMSEVEDDVREGTGQLPISVAVKLRDYHLLEATY